MNDHILRITAADGMVRAFFASTRELASEAASRHKTAPTATAALGRLLTAAAIMGHTLKNDKDLLTVTVKGDGPLGGLLATADWQGNVKGYCHNPSADLPLNEYGKLDVGGAVGEGTLTIVKDMGLKEPYSGQVELVSGEIAMDIAYYYALSEQTPSIVSLGVLVDKDLTVRQAGGFFIQLMPGADEGIIDLLEKNAIIHNLTELLDGGITTEGLAEITLGELGFEVMERLPCRFHCGCDKKKVARVLTTLPQADLRELIDGDKTEVMCHFCNTAHVFGKTELEGLMK
jgi:molecular chaperone Hsp33